MPRDAQAVEAAARGGELAETSRFEAKEALPASKKNVDIATDVSAMTVAGGQILYGLAEDEHREPPVPQPIELNGAAERIGNVVSTSVAEVPAYTSRAFPLADDPSRGYLLLTVPPSSRAPHMVTVKGEGRYYGRGDKANRILSEDEVARLYERRARWDVDRDALLGQTIAAGPFAPEREHGYLHAFIQPVPPDRELWSRATNDGRDELLAAVAKAAGSVRTNQPHSPEFPEGWAQWTRKGSDVWVLATDKDGDNTDPGYSLRLSINIDGRATLFCGRAAERFNRQGQATDAPLYLFEHIVTGTFASFLAAMYTFYEQAEYLGSIDVGVAVTGIAEAISARAANHLMFHSQPFGADTYPRTARLSLDEIAEPRSASLSLVGDLVEATAGEGYEIFNPIGSPR